MRTATLIFCLSLLFQYHNVAAQDRKCGQQALMEAIAIKHPEFVAAHQALKDKQAKLIEDYKQQNINSLAKTTSTYAIPVVFHIILNTTQLNQLGGTSGIEERLDSQIAVLNRDYNAANPDYSSIPSVFQPLYGNVGIQFGLAHLTPDGQNTPGYEIITTNANGININGTVGSTLGFSDAKYSSSGGADIWDPSIYLNVWILNPLGASGLLGLTIPRSYAVTYGISQKELGIVCNYGAFGVRTNVNQYYISNITGGRTLTHEFGHYFEMNHTWGDDNGLCPWNGGSDDGIADTPPQANATYGCPSFPLYDACDTTGNPLNYGIMFMNYMDYTNDACMNMFTKNQCTVMQSNVAPGGESYSLTQHDNVLHYLVGITAVEKENPFNIYPNPATDNITVNFSKQVTSLQYIDVVNMLGQQIRHIDANTPVNNAYTINLANINKGIYLVQCHFKEDMVTRKIVLQ